MVCQVSMKLVLSPRVEGSTMRLLENRMPRKCLA